MLLMLVIDDKFTSPLKHWQAHIDGTFNGFDRAVRKLKANHQKMILYTKTQKTTKKYVFKNGSLASFFQT